jgi:hypothetical protein
MEARSQNKEAIAKELRMICQQLHFILISEFWILNSF